MVYQKATDASGVVYVEDDGTPGVPVTNAPQDGGDLIWTNAAKLLGLYQASTIDPGHVHSVYEAVGSVSTHESTYNHALIATALQTSSQVDHDQTTNFVAAEHIDWTNTTQSLYTTGTGRFGSVGIGTADPAEKLEISGHLLFQNKNNLKWKKADGTATTILQLYDDNAVYLDSPSSFYMRSGGNAFLQGTSSTIILSKATKLASDNQKLYFGAADDAAIWFNGTALIIDPDLVTSTDICQVNGYLDVTKQVSGRDAIRAAGSSSFPSGSGLELGFVSGQRGYIQAYNRDASTYYDVVFPGGKVGIGEVSPDYKLDVNGTFGFTPGASVTPVDNGDVVFELTDNTTLTIKAKGSDGTVRSVALTLV